MQICAGSHDASLPRQLPVPTRTWKGAELTAVLSTHFCALSSEKGKGSRAGTSEEAGFESSWRGHRMDLVFAAGIFVLTNPRSPVTSGFQIETTLLHLRRKLVTC